MGLRVVLEDEQGREIESVEDPANILHQVLPSPDDNTFCYLNRIDWYGDTTFNRLQIADIRQELERLIKAPSTGPNAVSLLERIGEFAVRSQSEPHLYVKFYGD
jgi:hypothetical protein